MPATVLTDRTTQNSGSRGLGAAGVDESAAARADEAGALAESTLAALRSSKLPGLIVPVEYGGSGSDSLALNQAIAELSRTDPSSAIIMFQHAAVAARVAEWGTVRQKARILPRLADGTWLAASSWSEPGAGAAKRALSTTAEQAPDGTWVIDGGKSFTTGAGLADIYLVLTQTDHDESDERAYGSAGQTFFLLPGDDEGLVPDTSMQLAGMRSSATGFVELHRCQARPDSVLGERGGAARIIAGVRESGASLGAVAVGIAEAAWMVTRDSLSSKGALANAAIRATLVDQAARIASARGIVEAAGRRESPNPGELTLLSKIEASQTAEESIGVLARLLGSAGYVDAHPINRMARDARAVALMGPTNDLARELVGRGWLA